MMHRGTSPTKVMILALAIAALAACAVSAPGTPAPTSSAPAAQATPTPKPPASPSPPPPTPTKAVQAANDVGYLEGRATIGPLTPVERVGVPTPPPPPEVCTVRSLTIYEADGKTEVTSVNLQPDCTYRVLLKPGAYVVALRPGRGIEHSKDLPKTVLIESGKTVRLDISIDTGIR